MIWQVGNGSDEAACANALGTKNGVVPFTSKQAAEEDPFKGLTKQSTLQIVANLSIIDGTAGNLTPEKMAQFLIWGGLKEVDHISLVICNSAVELKALKGQSFAARFRQALIDQAKAENMEDFFVGKISSRKGYVNAYNEVLADQDIAQMVRDHFKSTEREVEIGRKYSHTECTVKSKENVFLDKGTNKETLAQILIFCGKDY